MILFSWRTKITKARVDMNVSDTLIDGYGRTVNYARISVTDRCNFRCVYCMPAQGVQPVSHSEILRYEDIEFLGHVMFSLGVKKFRFTGGEPLVRRGFLQFLKRFREFLPHAQIALTTNGSLLSLYAGELAQIGLDSLNVSLDTIDAAKFARITRIGALSDVLSGISAAKAAGIAKIKLNAVLMRDTVEGAAELLSFARREGLLLRFIELMPLEKSFASASEYVSARTVMDGLCGGRWEELPRSEGSTGPAKYYRNCETGDVVGVIAAMTGNICETCGRLRVSSQGRLRTCLFEQDGVDLSGLIRARDAEGLAREIISAVRKKPERRAQGAAIHMSEIGG